MDIVIPVWSQLVHVTKISAPTNNFLSVINNSSYSPPHLVTSVPISGGHCESSHCIFQGRSGRSMLAAWKTARIPKCCFCLFSGCRAARAGSVQQCGTLGEAVNEDSFTLVPTRLFRDLAVFFTSFQRQNL